MKESLSWLPPRIVYAVLAVVLAVGVGLWAETMFGLHYLSLLVAATSGVALVAIVDGLRGHQLLQWLSGGQDGPAPRDTGLFGELGYRIEKAVRERDRTITRERLQLAQFLSAIEASPNGVLMLDEQDHIHWCNQVGAEHFALDARRDLRQRITNLVRSPGFVGYLQAGQFAEPLVLPNVRGAGTLSVVVRGYGDGMKLVLSQDITERERADGMRRDFVANVSHEIRTPLTVLSGFIETMSSLPLSEAERRRVLQLMGQQTQRMQTLVSDLLTLAQLEGSRRPPADHWVSLDALLKRVASDANALSGGKHAIRVQSTTRSELAGAEPELLSAVANLVTNAVRYTPAGGEIDVAWRQLPDGVGELSVCDTGVGIAREHIPRLTERFYRVDGSRSRETGGTGLGLSIVKHVLQRHGGQLQVESEPGKGSKFKLILPASRIRQASDNAIGAEAASSVAVGVAAAAD